MKTFFVEKENFINNMVILQNMEHNHLKNVLRLNVGEQVKVVCNDDFNYICRIESIEKNKTILSILNKELNLANPKSNLTVFMALIKNEHENLIVQKLTELGVSTIIPFESKYTVVKNSKNKIEKLQQISNQSIKQCGRSKPIKIMQTINLLNINFNCYDKVIFANECETNLPINNELSFNSLQKNIAIIIGPEGGFSPEERNFLVNNGAVSVSLGQRILRAETAAIMLSTLVLYNLGEYK